jgi:hypothetical protein
MAASRRHRLAKSSDGSWQQLNPTMLQIVNSLKQSRGLTKETSYVGNSSAN